MRGAAQQRLSMCLGWIEPYWATLIGPLPILCMALAVRLLAFVSFLGFEWAPIPGQRWLAVAAFFLIALPWAPLSVSSKSLTARLSPWVTGRNGLF